MKKYSQPVAKVFAILTATCLAMIIIGILLILLVPEQFNLILLFMGIGIPMGILFLACFPSSARSYILMDDAKIVFPITRAPRLSFKRNTVLFSQIKSISVNYHPATKPNVLLAILSAILLKDAMIGTKETYFYKFHLKNGLEFTETFNSYGKKQEEEILEKLREKIRFV